MGFVKQKACSKAKIDVEHFKEIKEEFLNQACRPAHLVSKNCFVSECQYVCVSAPEAINN